MGIFQPNDYVCNEWSERARSFCNDFSSSGNSPKFILGKNIYSESVVRHFAIDGFVDDFNNEGSNTEFKVISSDEIPKNALVLNAAGGRPLTARRKLDQLGIKNLDYFAFRAITGLPLVDIRFNEGFEADFKSNVCRYEWLYRLLGDDESKEIFKKLVGFRLTHNLAFLDGFQSREDWQYFEDFLELQVEGETFIDVGGYNGFTSLQFASRCPRYSGIHLFEPNPENYDICVSTLKHMPRVWCSSVGLAEVACEASFESAGSSSRVRNDGAIKIRVERLDELLEGVDPTFLKMDIEGGEAGALKGASETIKKYSPRMAISVYHSAGDFWRVPEQVLSVNPSYKILLRHYTESIYETVMFFLPDKRGV